MNNIAYVICFLSLAGLLHTYLFYPWFVQMLARYRKPAYPPSEPKIWPQVSILMSVYNEASVIEEKLQHLAALQYPPHRLSVWVGSDASSDSTNALLLQAERTFPGLRVHCFNERRGKPSVLNDLAAQAFAEHPAESGHILLITDANVMPEPDILRELMPHFAHPKVALVDARMENIGLEKRGISRSEHTYIHSEVGLKHAEGKCWGLMMGPFGGCYALRSNYFQPIPAHHLVDDFYLAMRVFEQGGKALSALTAVCREAVSQDLREEFRRKARISAGNFQNLQVFRQLWWPPFSKLAFVFLSHKILRWIGPFLMFFLLLGSGFLAFTGNLFFALLFSLQLGLYFGVPLLDWLLRKADIHILLFRHIRYFVSMNLALFRGYLRYRKGIRSGAWEPPKRV